MLVSDTHERERKYMKLQDIVFFVIFLLILIVRRPTISAWLGMLSLFFALPLFVFWVFFTAERLTWYAAGFFLLAIGQSILQSKKR